MRNVAVVIALVVLLTIVAGCVQPRIGSPEYSDPYGNTVGSSDKRWWGEESSGSELNVDKFLYRWRGLTE